MTGRWPLTRLGDVVATEKRTVQPEQFAQRLVQHFSIPAFDAGERPHEVDGASIKSAKIELSRPVVLLSKLNPHLPRAWVVTPDQVMPALCSTEFLPLVPDERHISLGYLYAVVQSDSFRAAMASRVTGTSTSHQRVKPRDCLDIQIPLPPLAEQGALADLLLSLNARLSLTRQARGVSQVMLRKIFREDFPDCLTGDRGQALGDVVRIQGGVSYRSDDLVDQDQQALVTLKCFGRQGEYRSQGLKAYRGDAKPDQVVVPGEIIVAQTDLTQAGDVLGSAVVVRQTDYYRRLVVSLDVAVVRPAADVPNEFLIGLMLQPEFRAHCRAHANGTTVLHLPRKAIPAFKFNRPEPAKARMFVEKVAPLIARDLIGDGEIDAVLNLRAASVRTFFAAAA